MTLSRPPEQRDTYEHALHVCLRAQKYLKAHKSFVSAADVSRRVSQLLETAGGHLQEKMRELATLGEVDEWVVGCAKLAGFEKLARKGWAEARGGVLEREFNEFAEEDGAAETLVRRITGDNGTHVVSYGTEAGQFQAAGYSAVVCGPGDIAQAHQPNEFITIAQFEAGHAFMRDLLHHLG